MFKKKKKKIYKIVYRVWSTFSTITIFVAAKDESSALKSFYKMPMTAGADIRSFEEYKM